ncbi:MAG: autotransporter domain-containing protein [Pseudomonadota bacterium]
MAHLNRAMSCSLIALTIHTGVAFAQDTNVDSDRTTPLVTSTDGNVTVTTDGTVTVNGEAAIVIDSDNTVVVDGAVVVDGDVADIAGVTISGPRTLNYSQEGDITLDSSGDFDADTETLGPFPANRWGILSEDGATLTGDFTFGSDADITVETDTTGGGIRLGGDLIGSFVSSGGVTVLGDGATGISLQGVSGDITFNEISAFDIDGVDADGIVIEGAVGGQLTYGGQMTLTAFTDTTPDQDTDENNNNAQQIAQTSGDGLVVRGNVAGGVLIDGVVDLNNDGSFDAENEPGQGRAAQISIAGGGNALQLDGVSIGTVINDPLLPDDYGDWSLINRGALSGNGVYDTVDVETVLLRDTTFTSGIRNDGIIQADAETAQAIALNLAGTTSAPTLLNTSDIVSVTNGAGEVAFGLVIDTDASLPTLTNNDQISAASTDGASFAVRDLSGTLTSIVNTGIISATADDDDGFDGLAIDLSANTSGVVINNTIPDGTTASNSNFGFIVGDVRTGTGDDTFLSNAGAITGDIDLGDGNDRLELSEGTVFVGAITVGAGDDTVIFDAVNASSQIDFGTGADRLELSGGAVWTGTYTGDANLSVLLDASSLQVDNATTLLISDLTVQNGGNLSFLIDENSDDTARIQSSGTVTIDSSSSLAFEYATGFAGSIETTLIDAAAFNIDLAAVNANTETDGSFLVEEVLSFGDETETSLVLTRRRRDATDVGLAAELQGAFDPALTALSVDDELTTAIFGLNTEEEFVSAFSQLLPDPLDMSLNAARAQNSSIGTLISDRSNLVGAGREKVGRIWFQEQFFYLDRSADQTTTGYSGGGIMIALGADTPLLGLDVVGGAVSFSASRFDTFGEADLPSNRTSVNFDAYAAKRLGNLSLDVRGGVGTTSSTSERNIELNGVIREFSGDWDGSQTSASGRVQYALPAGAFKIIPAISFDFLSLTEDEYTEQNPDNSLALSALEREYESMRVNTGVSLAWRRGEAETDQIGSSRGQFGGEAVTLLAVSAGVSTEMNDDPLTAQFRFNEGDVFEIQQQRDEQSIYAGVDFFHRTGIIRVSGGVYGEMGDNVTMGIARISVGVDF